MEYSNLSSSIRTIFFGMAALMVAACGSGENTINQNENSDANTNPTPPPQAPAPPPQAPTPPPPAPTPPPPAPTPPPPAPTPPPPANNAPVANAGPDQNVTTSAIVNLNGSNSSDMDNDSLTYSWSFVSRPANSTAMLSSNTVVNPSFTADLDGNYVISLIVNDGTISSSADNITVSSMSANNAPVANAGSNQNVTTGTIVNLNGGNSIDMDNDLLTYMWSLDSRPANSSAVLSSNTVVNPNFTADEDGNYVINLVVNDGTVSSNADSLTVTSTSANSAPVANAGPDENVTTGDFVTLDGNSSSDADGDPLTYMWSFVSRPTNSNASLNTDTLFNPSFAPDLDGSYTLSLVVNDGQVNSAADTVVITSTSVNSAPTANAGSDQNVTTGNAVNLNGSNSSDADNDALAYSWSFVSKPDGSNSNASLNDTTAMNPSFTPDVDGSYLLSLTVNDGSVDSAPDNVLVTSTTPSGAARFDDFAGNGSLIGYTVNNPDSLPDVTRTNSRYRANLTSNANNITLHYNARQGRLDAKLATFPFEVIARNVGIGTQADSQTAPPQPTASQYIFAGIQVHVPELSSRNSSHLVVGYRGGTRPTVEGKNTVNSVSTVTDEGNGSAPVGRADLRIVGNADRTLTVYWQQPNLSGGADNWQLYAGNGRLPGAAPIYGATVYVGLITYAQDNRGIPFVGTCDSFSIID